MAKFDIRHEVGIQASPEAIYQALTDVKKLSQWWTSDTRGTSKVGESLEFRFGDFCQKMEVAALEPNRLVRWRPSKEGIEEWVGTTIEFSLEPEDDQCLVIFSHADWKSNTGMYPHCSMKWAIFLLSLKDLLEKGKGQPHPHDVQINHY